MARVPISFCLNILAGIIVLFNHYVAFETGDVALNKITGAAGRLYTLFRDTTLTFQEGCAAQLETAFCGPTLGDLLPHDAVAYIQVHYCHAARQGSERDGGTNYRRPHGGHGSSDFAFVHYQPMRPHVSRTSAVGLGRSPYRADRLGQRHGMQAIWHRSGEGLILLGTLFIRTCASWWWFRAPVEMTGILLATFSAMLTLGCVFGSSVMMGSVSQVCEIVAADFLRCTEWEAQRRFWDIGVMVMERAYVWACHVCA